MIYHRIKAIGIHNSLFYFSFFNYYFLSPKEYKLTSHHFFCLLDLSCFKNFLIFLHHYFCFEWLNQIYKHQRNHSPSLFYWKKHQDYLSQYDPFEIEGYSHQPKTLNRLDLVRKPELNIQMKSLSFTIDIMISKIHFH